MIEAVIFDMDGVLVDNHESWSEFDKKFLQQFNIESNDAYSVFVNGRSMEEVIIWLKKHYQLDDDVDNLLSYKEDWVRKVYEEGSKPMSAVEDLLKKIKANNFKLALCSGAKMWMIQIILDRFKWHDYFEVVVSSDHVNYRGKPDPEIYLHTARLLQVNPENCLVFEDAENGVTAAKSADMKCIGYKDLRFKLPDDLNQADFVVNSFNDEKILEFLDIK